MASGNSISLLQRSKTEIDVYSLNMPRKLRVCVLADVLTLFEDTRAEM